MSFHDDPYYITQVLQGNINAFSHLVEKYKRLAYTLALKLVQVPEDAEEIAQDAFVKAFQALGSFKGKSKFSTWLYRIIYNVSLARLRKKQLSIISIDDDEHSDFDVCETDDLLTTLTLKEQHAALRSALDQLAAEEKALITLYYMNESTIKEITQITGDTESNVKVKLFRARRKLWKMLKYHFRDKIITVYEK
ncbi:MAG: RNA polymerase sigma factor [Bacteroidales bacterium]|nr:RNA polymerase sigma factor [Bacteroidales bacterium]